MYAVIETGGKQYRVTPGDVIDVERGAAVDDDGAVRFERVLMVGGDGDVKVGTPLVEGVLVHGSLVGEVRGPKIKVFKMKRRKGYRRTAGHRQDLLRVQIDGIGDAGEAKAAKPAKKKAADEEPASGKPAKKAAKPAGKKAAAGKPAAKKAAEKKPAGKKPAKKAAADEAPEKKSTKKKAAAAEPAEAAGGDSAEKE